MITFRFTSEKYGWMSNFSKHVCYQNGYRFVTSEHLYHSRKLNRNSLNYKENLANLLNAPTAKDSKHFINTLIGTSECLTLKEWELIRNITMMETLTCKLQSNPELIPLLKETGTQELVEVSKYDLYWAKNLDLTCGDNWLGKCWMSLREII